MMGHPSDLDFQKYLQLTREIARLEAERATMVIATCPAARGDLIEFKYPSQTGPTGQKRIRGRVDSVFVNHARLSPSDEGQSRTPSWVINANGIRITADEFVRVVQPAKSLAMAEA